MMNQLPPGYAECVQRLTDAADQWLSENLETECRIGSPIVPECIIGTMEEAIASGAIELNEGAKQCWEAMKAAVDDPQEVTVLQALTAIRIAARRGPQPI